MRPRLRLRWVASVALAQFARTPAQPHAASRFRSTSERPKRSRAAPAAVAGLTALGAVLRFSTLGAQEYWIDESVTVGLLGLGFGDMLATAVETESTPPLYYAAAWVWVQVLGTSEVGLRSLSALAGTLTIPVAYLAARDFVSKRAGLAAATLAAVSPQLVWYSQEARSYAFLVLLSALSLLFFARTLRRPTGRGLTAWTAASALALVTHYFAIFLVAVEAVWLLVAWRWRPRVVAAVTTVGAAGLAVLPLLLHQRAQGHTDFLATYALPSRVVELVGSFLAGQTGQRVWPAVLALACLAAAALILLLVGTEPLVRRGARTPAAVGGVGLAIPLLLAGIGFDYVLARNFLPLWLPVAIVVAAGLSSRHAPRLAAATFAAFALLMLAVTVSVQLDDDLGRTQLTADILPPRYDRGRDDLTVRIAYLPPGGVGSRPVVAQCSAGYRATGGLAELVPSRRPVPSGPGNGGTAWTIDPPPPTGEDPVAVVAICAPTETEPG